MGTEGLEDRVMQDKGGLDGGDTGWERHGDTEGWAREWDTGTKWGEGGA